MLVRNKSWSPVDFIDLMVPIIFVWISRIHQNSPMIFMPSYHEMLGSSVLHLHAQLYSSACSCIPAAVRWKKGNCAIVIWCAQSSPVQPGPAWSSLIGVGPTWSILVQPDAIRPNLVQPGPSWSILVQLCPAWSNPVQLGPHLSSNGPSWSILV